MRTDSDPRRLYGGLFALAMSLLLGWTDLAAGAEASLQALVKEYQAAKKEWIAARQAAQVRRGGGQRGGGARRPEPRPLEPILSKIIRQGGAKGQSFVAREYADPDPDIAAACGGALLASGDEKAVKIVTSGFDRGGLWGLSARARVLDALASSKTEEGLSFVIRLVQRADPESRAIALGSLAPLTRSEAALDAILSQLDQRALEVRRAALRSLRDFRSKKMIAPLIERVGKEDDEALRIDALQLLVDLTGHNMGFVAADWLKWWEIAEERFEFKKSDEGKTRVVTPDLTYFGIEVTSKRISFLIDASNSMLGVAGGGGGQRGGRKGGGGQPGGGTSKIDVLKEELTRILKKLPEDSAINIIYFYAAVVPWKKELHFLRGSGRSEAIAFVQDLSCNWGTNIYDTLELALRDQRVDTLYLLSDGRPVGGRYSQPEDILREIGAINRVRGARIHCISFGQETELLRKLAAENGGVYRATNPRPAAGKKGGGKKQ